MSSPRSISSTKGSQSTMSLVTSKSLSSSATTAPIASPIKLETTVSTSSTEQAMSHMPIIVKHVSSMTFDVNKVIDDSPYAHIIDHNKTRKGQVVSPSPSGKELVQYIQETHRPENLQDRIGEVIKDVVNKEVVELMKLADAEIEKELKAEHDSRTRVAEETFDSMKVDKKFMIVVAEQAQANHESLKVKDKEETSQSMTEDNKHMIVTIEQAQAGHENPKIKDMNSAVNSKSTRSASKQVANISNISFKIPDDFEIDDDTINKFAPEDEVIRVITSQNEKKFSFSERLHGWKMKCKIRLSGVRQYDKYITHVKSKTVTRSVPEVVRFILYEVNPKQMRDANRKRKSVNVLETPKCSYHCSLQERLESPLNVLKPHGLSMSSKDITCDIGKKEESYVEMFLRVAWSNQMNDIAEEVPSITEWEELKASKEKVRTLSCEQDVGSPNLDAEVADALMN